MADKRMCPLCDEELEDAPVVHDIVKCEKTELHKGRQKIKKLTQSVNAWKDNWYHLNEIIGWLWWYHPAIQDDNKRSHYQEAQRSIQP